MKTLFQQRGMTLIELMIAGVLSLVISYFIMNIMITSSRTARLAEGVAQAQETGRLVMAWLNDGLSIAGYNSNYLSNGNDVYPVVDLCGGGHCTLNSDKNTDGGDHLAIRRTAGGLTPGARDTQTCTGEALPSAMIDNQSVVIDVYWVKTNEKDTDTTNDYQLWCATYDENGNIEGSAQSIANGVESMQIQLGIGDSIGNVSQFVPPSSGTDWPNVVAVRIALLTREFGNATLSQDKRYYGLLDSEPVLHEDRVARYVQTGTIWFPNTQKM